MLVNLQAVSPAQHNTTKKQHDTTQHNWKRSYVKLACTLIMIHFDEVQCSTFIHHLETLRCIHWSELSTWVENLWAFHVQTSSKIKKKTCFHISRTSFTDVSQTDCQQDSFSSPHIVNMRFLFLANQILQAIYWYQVSSPQQSIYRYIYINRVMYAPGKNKTAYTTTSKFG